MSGVEVFAATVDGSYSLTVAVGTSVWGVVEVLLFLGEGGLYCLLFIIMIFFIFFIYYMYIYIFCVCVCVYFNN